MTPNVIDIYHGNNVKSFSVLRQNGILGVIHKCSQGAGYADPAYSGRRTLARNAGLLWGAYSFNTGEKVDAQVEELLSHAQVDDQTLVCLDFEDNPKSEMSVAQAEDWVSKVEAKIGRWPVVYSGNRVKDLLGSHVSPILRQCRLWLAQYGPTPRLQPSWSSWWLWQYSEQGRLPGTDGAIDLDFYSGSEAQLRSEWSGVAPAAPTSVPVA